MVLFVLCGLHVSAQSDEVIINNVNFVGNKKTKDRVIIFEMAINEGDTIALDDLNGMIALEEKKTGTYILRRYLNLRIEVSTYGGRNKREVLKE